MRLSVPAITALFVVALMQMPSRIALAQDANDANPFELYYGRNGASSSSYNANAIQCKETTISDWGAPLVASGPGQSVHHMRFGESIGGEFGMETFANRQGISIHSATNRVWQQSKIGDRVQVCLLAIPARTDTCNPDLDKRGREFYVYNYRLHGAFIETTGEHSCGGA